VITQRSARLAIVGVVLAVAVGSSCGSGGGDSLQPGPRRRMLADVARIVIVPTYQSLAAAAEVLQAAAVQLDATPDAAALASLQSAWRRARSSWKQSEAFAIGPAKTLRMVARIDWSPVRSDNIEDEIAGTNELTAAYVRELGASSKGFLAIEYLVFDPAGGDAAVLQSLAADPRRRRFVRVLAENLRDEAVTLRDTWAPGAGDFAAELGNAGAGSTAYPTVKSAVDELVNQVIFLSEDVADTQLLAVLGTRTGGTPRPEALDAHRSENGLADLLDNLAGIQAIYFDAYGGVQGTSLSDIVERVSPTTDGVLAVAIRRALETASRIPQPLELAASTDRELVEHAQVRAKNLMARLEIDLISALGATLRFNPSDGD
jgi:predicted lipoprotein